MQNKRIKNQSFVKKIEKEIEREKECERKSERGGEAKNASFKYGKHTKGQKMLSTTFHDRGKLRYFWAFLVFWARLSFWACLTL